VVDTDGGEVIFHKPIVYQPATYNELRTTNGGRHFVEGRYVLRGDNRIAFQLAGYDRRRPVVIDPVLAYSSYLGGGASDSGAGIAVDVRGNAYVTGSTQSYNFPPRRTLSRRLWPGGRMFSSAN
jgi:Beta-propeller repeat